MYRNRIAQLTESHRLLDKQIANAEKSKTDDNLVADLKKKKLQLKDEISRLNRMQFEYDHDNISFDDDR